MAITDLWSRADNNWFHGLGVMTGDSDSPDAGSIPAGTFISFFLCSF